MCDSLITSTFSSFSPVDFVEYVSTSSQHWSSSYYLIQGDQLMRAYIANDVVSDYGQVKELLAQFYRRAARKYGNDYFSSKKTKLSQEITRKPFFVKNTDEVIKFAEIFSTVMLSIASKRSTP
ncbi:hypothetical protein ANCDUO_01031 [Ancylostoma duodenale]|uniref:Uncharacterized protein n=1 Tax=Ancylostoma duodenale TaxID=51022 RepID=A0A0C2DZY5_9BILA|nr:hypothetical protein ANCDUO_01031 [Ancylostoma duodenale]